MSDSQSTSSSQKEFSPLRSALWPVHGYEMKKFMSMSLLMLFILFVYTMVRDLKDALVQYYTVAGGTELITQLKLFFVTPMAVLMVMLYSILINKLGFKKTFYTMVTGFMAFYIVFLLILFPNRALIHPGEATVKAMQASWPPFLYWTIPCITNWSISLFYVLSEMWGTMAISSLFWQFAYKATMSNEVKRFFPTYAIVANIGVMASAGVLKWVSATFPGERSIYICVTCSIICGFITMGIFWYINNVILKDPRYFDASQIKEKKKKEKVGVMDGIKMLFQNSYLLLICAIVMCYGIAINFCEVIWKAYMKMKFSDANDYQDMMGNLSLLTGLLTIVASLGGQYVLRKVKWKTAALIPALLLAVLGGVFFTIVLLHRQANVTTILGMDAIALAVWFGMAQDALSKSVKYCLFDSTKNMAYLPLDQDTKTKGQAAVEVIGGRFGKSGASAIQFTLINLIAAGSKLTSHVVTISIVFALTAIGWVSSVFGLSKKYEAKIAQNSSDN